MLDEIKASDRFELRSSATDVWMLVRDSALQSRSGNLERAGGQAAGWIKRSA